MKLTQEIKALLAVAVVTLAIIVGAIFLLTKSSSTTPQSSAPLDEKILIREDSYKIATESAKVTIVEFGDYQCPACAAVHPNVKQLLQNYAGKVNYVVRNFPLPQHKNALISAEAAEAAGVQGKFWEMHDKLYETQEEWAEENEPLNKFIEYAKDLGLDTVKFEADIKANKYQDKIKRDYTDGNNLRLTFTPTFFINGQKLETVPSYEEFKAKIDPLL